MNKLQRTLNRARWWLLSEQPFYGQLASGLEDVSQDVGTACTNGRQIEWDPAFLEGLSEEEVRAVLVHETLHCAHGHLWRFQPIDAEANEACDYVVNAIVAQIPGCKLPKGALECPPEFADWDEERIYAALKARKKPPQGGKDKGPGKGPGIGDFEAPAEDQEPGNGTSKLKEEWEERTIQAEQAGQASGQGKTPADMARELARLRAQRVDWRRELADFVKTAIGQRNDWSRSNRRSATQPVIYPRKRQDDLGTVVFARDTSGSITDAVCAEFSAVVSAVMAEVGCAGIVLDCDAEIKAEYRLAAGDECPLKAQGGGGTDFRPVFTRADKLEEEGERIAGVVYLTDLQGTFRERCDRPTLWIATMDGTAPHGRVVKCHE